MHKMLDLFKNHFTSPRDDTLLPIMLPNTPRILREEKEARFLRFCKNASRGIEVGLKEALTLSFLK